MRVGQPKLFERVKRSLVVTPTYLQCQVNLGAEDYGLKELRIFKSEKVQQPSFYCDAFLYA
jgi:hypothetical protein